MRLIFIIVVLVFSCGPFNAKQRLNWDIELYKDIFEHNRTAFQAISDSIKSIAGGHSPFTFEPNDFRKLASRISIYTNGRPVDYAVEIDSINGTNYFFRIRSEIKNKKSPCSILSYCYIDKSIKAFLGSNDGRNITYELLDNNWSLEIDQSSPCID